MAKWKPKADYIAPDHYQAVTDRIVAALEAGKVPWRKPWDPDKATAGGGLHAPQNPVSGTRYRGINALVLGMDPRAFTTGDPRWVTFNQAKDKGWSVRKGEKGTAVFFYRKLEVDDPDAKEGKKTIPLLKSFTVFHASQVDGIPPYVAATVADAAWRRPEAADTILKNSGAVVRLGGDRAFYSPSSDHIQLPPDKAFHTPHDWAATALHELGHWTGHKDRLNRDLTGRFGSGAYAQEELRAELSSAFIAAEVGIPSGIPNHASYIGSWMKALRDDKREIFRAASDAQKIADMCLGFHPEWKAARDAEMKADAAEAAEEAAPAPAAKMERADASRPSFPADPAPAPSFSREDFAAAMARRNPAPSSMEPDAAPAFRR